MKSSEAKNLNADELITLADLMQRWILTQWPYETGRGAEGDAIQTYLLIKKDATRGYRTPTVLDGRIDNQL